MVKAIETEIEACSEECPISPDNERWPDESPHPRRLFLAAILSILAIAALFAKSKPQLPSVRQVSELPQVQWKEEKAEQAAPAPFAPLLFCFAVVRTTGYEPDLMNAQYENKAGLFSCDDHQLYSTGGVVDIGGVTTVEAVGPEAEADSADFKKQPGASTNSWLNTKTFLEVWDLVIEEGKWWTADWTVKIDPDAVFFPDRLRKRMEPHTGGLNARPSWVGNCDRTWHDEKPHLKLFGSIEIFSRNAMGTYKAFGKTCEDELDWSGWGEDMFMQFCMDKLHVQAINGTDMLGDARCYDAPCTDFTKVAFHDFKQIDPFFQCWGQSIGSEHVYEKEQERIKEQAKLEKERLEKLRLQALLHPNITTVTSVTTIATPILPDGIVDEVFIRK